jgi:hypothetical protein
MTYCSVFPESALTEKGEGGGQVKEKNTDLQIS